MTTRHAEPKTPPLRFAGLLIDILRSAPFGPDCGSLPDGGYRRRISVPNAPASKWAVPAPPKPSSVPPSANRAEARATLLEVRELLADSATRDPKPARRLIVAASRATESDLTIDWEAISRIRNRLRNAAIYVGAGEWPAACCEIDDALNQLRGGDGGYCPPTGVLKPVPLKPRSPLVIAL